MIRKAFKMFVHPNAHAEYETRHRPIWKQLEDTLLEHGVLNYSIFLNTSANELFAYAEVEDEERWQAIASTEICQLWWRHMREVMPTNSDNSPKSIELREVFHIQSSKT
jgi:L-rhamnose mutarotase